MKMAVGEGVYPGSVVEVGENGITDGERLHVQVEHRR